jgi:hypothetical protein
MQGSFYGETDVINLGNERIRAMTFDKETDGNTFHPSIYAPRMGRISW